MGRTPRDITDAELSVLQVLWQQGPRTIRQIVDVLYPQGSPAQYATVKKLLERMESKGVVDRDRSKAVHVFAAGIDRYELAGRRIEAVAETLCGGSWTPLLTHLVQAKKLSEKDRRTLRELIDDLDTSDQQKSPTHRRGKGGKG